MSDVKFGSVLVANLGDTLKEGFSEENIKFLEERGFEMQRDECSMLHKNNILQVEPDKNGDLAVISRVILEDGSSDNVSYVSLGKILEFRYMVEQIFGQPLECDDVSIQTYNWYNCSEEPFVSL